MQPEGVAIVIAILTFYMEQVGVLYIRARYMAKKKLRPGFNVRKKKYEMRLLDITGNKFEIITSGIA